MKKMLLTILLLVFASIVSFAVEYKAADVPDCGTNPEGFLAYWKTVTSPAIKMARKVRLIVQFECRLGQLEKTVPAIDARIAELAVENKLNADEVVFGKVYCYLNGGLAKEALALAEANITIPAVKRYIGYCYGNVGDYTKAVELGNVACKIKYVGKLSDVTLKYNTCISLLLDNKLNVALVNRLKGTFLRLRTRGTDITNAQKLADYQDIQDAYSAMVMKDGKRVYVYDTFLAELTAAITRLKARM